MTLPSLKIAMHCSHRLSSVAIHLLAIVAERHYCSIFFQFSTLYLHQYYILL